MKRIRFLIFLLVLVIVAGSWFVFPRYRGAKLKVAISHLHKICSATEAYRSERGELPPNVGNFLDHLHGLGSAVTEVKPITRFLPADYVYPETQGRVLTYELKSDSQFDLHLRLEHWGKVVGRKRDEIHCVGIAHDREDNISVNCDCSVLEK